MLDLPAQLDDQPLQCFGGVGQRARVHGRYFTVVASLMHELLALFIGLFVHRQHTHCAQVHASVGWVRSGSEGAGPLRLGLRQSMPSSNMESCAAESDTVPSLTCGHVKIPLLSRL